MCLSVCLPACLSVCLSTCISICLDDCLSVCPSSCCLSVCLFVYLSVCLSVCLSTWLSVYLFSILPIFMHHIIYTHSNTITQIPNLNSVPPPPPPPPPRTFLYFLMTIKEKTLHLTRHLSIFVAFRADHNMKMTVSQQSQM